jgi:uncharacterized NAD(P)/FAD-binding protein YdhS
MQQLLRNGVVRPHPFGGLRLDPDSCRTTGYDGTTGPDLYAVGSLAQGARYLTSGIGFLRAMIDGVVKDVARQIDPAAARDDRRSLSSNAA